MERPAGTSPAGRIHVAEIARPMRLSETSRVLVVVSLSALSAVGLAAALAVGQGMPGAGHYPAAAIIAVLVFAGRVFPIRIASRRHMVTDTAPLFTASLLLPPLLAGMVALVSVAGAELFARKRSRPDPRQVVFNGCQAMLGVAIAGALNGQVAHGTLPSADASIMWGVLLSAAAMLLVNDALVFCVLWAQLGIRLRRMLWDFARNRSDLPYDIALYGLGFLGALVGGLHIWLLPVLAVPAPLLYRAMQTQIALREQTREAVTALADIVDERDPYTYGHCKRVAEFSAAICARLGLSPDLTDEVVLAARVHDVGKIGIRDAVLLKPSALTDEEFAHIKEHPEIGARLTARFPDFASGTRYIRHHHERWDGSGYPTGLRGKEIPLGARIIAVADTYDAITSTRPYRSALSDDVAQLEMLRAAGSQLDPDVIQAWFAHKEWQSVLAVASPEPLRRAG
jgi:HD-GYP domain-containing protein (c-di-GMP phosphodiesterase class II)